MHVLGCAIIRGGEAGGVSSHPAPILATRLPMYLDSHPLGLDQVSPRILLGISNQAKTEKRRSVEGGMREGRGWN